MPNRIQLYVAAPLFTQAEWQWNDRLATELRSCGLDVILPQHRAEPMLAGVEKFDPQVLFRANIEAIERANVILAILDGADADSGTCWECGYAYGRGCPIIGLRTDIRAVGDDPKASTNLMLSMCCSSLIAAPPSKINNISWVAKQIAEAIQKAVGTLERRV